MGQWTKASLGLASLVALAGMAACVPQREPIIFAASDSVYLLDRGDKVKVTVFGQANLSSTYTVDASGFVTMPLIGAIPASGHSTAALQQDIAAKLRAGYLRQPNVTAEVETYRPFYVLGEVTLSGQYPYFPGLTAEKAVAIAGGYSPRARRDSIVIERRIDGKPMQVLVPMTTLVKPGDVITVRERWF